MTALLTLAIALFIISQGGNVGAWKTRGDQVWALAAGGASALCVVAVLLALRPVNHDELTHRDRIEAMRSAKDALVRSYMAEIKPKDKS